jgi:CheY-like chemotaxis protein
MGAFLRDAMTEERNKLLIVEDDATLRAVLARAMERRGYSVRVAEDAESALGDARAHVPPMPSSTCDCQAPPASPSYRPCGRWTGRCASSC